MSTPEKIDRGNVMDHLGNRPVESSAWIERMVWRTAFLILFILGLICYVGSDGNYLWLAFVAGGLFPGLFLMAREQGERHIEAQRRALGPESRHDDELPPLRGGRTVGEPPARPQVPRPTSNYRPGDDELDLPPGDPGDALDRWQT